MKSLGGSSSQPGEPSDLRLIINLEVSTVSVGVRKSEKELNLGVISILDVSCFSVRFDEVSMSLARLLPTEVK